MKTIKPTRREQSICNILEASLVLFRENSYHNTTVRQIAEKSGVALGMINHYFGSKEFLGAQVLALFDDYTSKPVPDYLSLMDDPILYDLVLVRVLFHFLFDHGYREFYLDSLQHDFFFNYLAARPIILIDLLKDIYRFEADQDSILLYSRYMPYMMEKTLILKKEEGLFSSIPYEDVPYIICQTAMSHFIPEADIRARDARSKELAAQIGRTLEDCPPHEAILEFVRQSETFKG